VSTGSWSARSSSATASRTGGVPSTRTNMATPRVRFVTRNDSLDPRSWLQHWRTTRLRSATAAMTWRSPPSPRWCHVSGR
jgi:hypothetical protein